MTAATMFMNLQGPLYPNMDGECNTPEIEENISNIMMNGLNGFYTQTPNISQYWFPDQQEAPNYAPSPAAPYSGQESSLPVFCDSMVAFSPPISPCSLFPPMDSSPMPNSVKEGFHQLVKEELKWTIRARRLNKGLPASPTEIASLKTREELTPEDEDRRKSRRERKIIVAKRLRNKKKEKTANYFVQESVDLEATNVRLNKEIQQLRAEIQRLKSVVENHRCTFPVHQNSHFIPMPIIYNSAPQPFYCRGPINL